MKHLLRMLRRGPFDWVILDVPSVMKSEDALTLSPLVDGVALVLAAERTRVGFAERAVQVLKTGSGPVVGAVLNRVSAAPRGRSIASWFRRAS
jgi:Mrp family chromosome partitioning ATPase